MAPDGIKVDPLRLSSVQVERAHFPRDDRFQIGSRWSRVRAGPPRFGIVQEKLPALQRWSVGGLSRRAIDASPMKQIRNRPAVTVHPLRFERVTTRAERRGRQIDEAAEA